MCMYVSCPTSKSALCPVLNSSAPGSTTSTTNTWHITHDDCLALHRNDTSPCSKQNNSGCSCVMTIHRFGGGDTSYGHHDEGTEPSRWPSHPVIRPAGALVTGLGFSGSLLCSPAAHPDHSEGEAAVPLGNSHGKCHQDSARSLGTFPHARASAVCDCHS